MGNALFRRSAAVAVLLAGVALAGCTHSVDLIPLDGGRPGIGDVAFRGGGMIVYFEGEAYSGRFIEGTDPALAEINAPVEAVEGPVATGRFWGVQGRNGPMGAVLSAKSGRQIACRFTYDPPEMIGSGLCRNQLGRAFSLRMR
jgi:hypothetical protein